MTKQENKQLTDLHNRMPNVHHHSEDAARREAYMLIAGIRANNNEVSDSTMIQWKKNWGADMLGEKKREAWLKWAREVRKIAIGDIPVAPAVVTDGIIGALMEAMSRQDFHDWYVSGHWDSWISGDEDAPPQEQIHKELKKFLEYGAQVFNSGLAKAK